MPFLAVSADVANVNAVQELDDGPGSGIGLELLLVHFLWEEVSGLPGLSVGMANQPELNDRAGIGDFSDLFTGSGICLAAHGGIATDQQLAPGGIEDANFLAI